MFIVKKKNVKYSEKTKNCLNVILACSFFSTLIFSEQTVEYKSRLLKQTVKICYFQDLQNV